MSGSDCRVTNQPQNFMALSNHLLLILTCLRASRAGALTSAGPTPVSAVSRWVGWVSGVALAGMAQLSSVYFRVPHSPGVFSWGGWRWSKRELVVQGDKQEYPPASQSVLTSQLLISPRGQSPSRARARQREGQQSGDKGDGGRRPVNRGHWKNRSTAQL